MKNSILIIPAREGDVNEIKALLKICSLPTEDVAYGKQSFWIVRDEKVITGVIGIEKYNSYGLLRSLAVEPSRRNQAIGKALLQHAITQAMAVDIETLFLLTTTAAIFFEKQGWVYSGSESVPDEVKQSEEFRSICPAGSVCMSYPVKEGVVKNAVDLFRSGFNCAQSVFSSFAPVLGMNTKDALKIASGFGAGICYKGEVCGAVSGAYMAIGLKYGRYISEDTEAKEKTYALMRDFDRQFIARNGSLYCNKLLDGDMSTPEGRQKINDERKFQTHCPRFVKDGTEIAEKLIGQ
jgi:C_GCAxxG_C_C family probable redox protein